MAYEKYIKKDGKLYGPYIYHSKRVDGKVVSEYHGQKKINYKKAILIVPFIFLIILGAYLLSNSQKKLTGNAILDLNANYQQGQTLNGNMKLSLDPGELIPADSDVVFTSNGQQYQYKLKDIVPQGSDTANGNFFMEGKNLSGSGQGFGTPGQKQVYPDVQFTLIISSPNQTQGQQSGENVSPATSPGENQSATGNGAANNTETSQGSQDNNASSVTTSSTETNSSSPGIFGAIANFFLSLTPTGHAVVEFQNEVSGSVSAGANFTYSLQPGETAEVKPMSVMSGGVGVPDNAISLTNSNGIVIVTTDYSRTDTGFGPGYSGQGTNDLNIDISKLNLSLGQGNLNVGIFYNGQQINSIDALLGNGQVSANESAPENNITQENQVNNQQTNVTIPDNTTVQSNITENATNVTKFSISINQNPELTDQEKATLAGNFGNSTVQVTEAFQKNGFITVRNEIGSYWIENSYPADLDNATLNSFMQQDRIKFLKDLAQTLSENQGNQEELPGYIGNYSY